MIRSKLFDKRNPKFGSKFDKLCVKHKQVETLLNAEV